MDETVHWNTALRHLANTWEQGQHVTLIGPTGTGKTTLAREVLQCRRFVAVLATKGEDDTMRGFTKDGYRKVSQWPQPLAPPYLQTRFVYHVPPPAIDDYTEQKDKVSAFLQDIYTSGRWCVYIDELRSVADYLGQKRPIVRLLTEGRSAGISVVTGFQRPSYVPLEVYDQASHIFAFSDPDERMQRKIGEAVMPQGALEAYRNLDYKRYECLYVDVRARQWTVTRVER